MWKLIKLAVGLLVLSGVGITIGQLNNIVEEKKEEKLYMYISYEYPGGVSSTIQIKEIPESKCDAIRQEYFQEAYKDCGDCKVITNECRKDKPELFSKAMSKTDIELPYIIGPYIYPEVIFFRGLPDGAFQQLCEMSKKDLESSICIE